MMNKIFISYRREDAADVTGRINDRLRQRYGEGSVFTDVDNIPFGVDFRIHLDKEVSKCNVLLAIIGRNWLNVKNDKDQPRLNDPTDFVRIEIESALRRSIPVIPLLVHGIKMPSTAALPEPLRELTFRNGIPIRPDPDFHKDMDRLIKGLDQHFQVNKEEEKSRENSAEIKHEAIAVHGQHKVKIEKKNREENRRTSEEEKPAIVKDVGHQEVTANNMLITALDFLINLIQPEFWKSLRTNVYGVVAGIVLGGFLGGSFMDVLYDYLHGDEMVLTLMIIPVCGISVGLMQAIHLRRYISNVTSWVWASVLGWAISGLFVGTQIAIFFLGWVPLMFVLPFIGGAVTGAVQARILRQISSRAYLWWVASTIAWPLGAAIGSLFGDSYDASILLVPLLGLLCWLVVTAATMGWLLTFGQNKMTEQPKPSKE